MGSDLNVAGLEYLKSLKICSIWKDMIKKITLFCLPEWVIPSIKAGWMMEFVFVLDDQEDLGLQFPFPRRKQSLHKGMTNSK